MFLNKFLVTVSSLELSAFEHRKLWCLQTLCWLHGEQSLPIGLLVLTYILSAQKNRIIETVLLSTHNTCFGSAIRKIVFDGHS